MQYQTICATVGENAMQTAWEIWQVTLPDGSKFEVSGETAAHEWVRAEGGECRFTGRYEAPSYT